MKASDSLRNKIAAAVERFDTPAARQDYRELRIPRAESVKDINVRYRWDAFWFATQVDRSILTDVSDENLSDAHIDTMLRSVVTGLYT